MSIAVVPIHVIRLNGSVWEYPEYPQVIATSARFIRNLWSPGSLFERVEGTDPPTFKEVDSNSVENHCKDWCSNANEIKPSTWKLWVSEKPGTYHPGFGWFQASSLFEAKELCKAHGIPNLVHLEGELGDKFLKWYNSWYILGPIKLDKK